SVHRLPPPPTLLPYTTLFRSPGAGPAPHSRRCGQNWLAHRREALEAPWSVIARTHFPARRLPGSTGPVFTVLHTDTPNDGVSIIKWGAGSSIAHSRGIHAREWVWICGLRHYCAWHDHNHVLPILPTPRRSRSERRREPRTLRRSRRRRSPDRCLPGTDELGIRLRRLRRSRSRGTIGRRIRGIAVEAG